MACGVSACKTCDELERIPEEEVVIKLPEDILDAIVSKNQKRKSEQSNHFYKCISAVLNNGTGIAILHTESPHLFGKFCEVVGNRLTELISDDSCYADNFEVSFHDDKHVIFRVKPVEGRRLSVFSFKTKLSVDKGLADMSHGQFVQLCKKYEQCKTGFPDTKSSSPREEIQKRNRELVTSQEKARFRESIPIYGQAIFKEFDFHEVVGIEAKSLIKLNSGRNKVETILSYIWNDLGLPRYITAFAKLPTGGSIFYGIRQDKAEGESKKWFQIPKKAAEKVKVLKILKPSHILWQSKQHGSVYLVAAESDFRQETYPEEDKGTFSYEYILNLNKEEQKLLSSGICDAARDRLLWLPEFPAENPVHVKFHRIREQPWYVVEVVIEHVPGWVFLDKDGPEIYCLKQHQPERLFLNPEALMQKIQELR